MKENNTETRFAPELLNDFVGQGAAIARIRRQLDKAKTEGRGYIPPLLLVGRRGIGKNRLAELISDALCARQERIDLYHRTSDWQEALRGSFNSLTDTSDRICVVGDLSEGDLFSEVLSKLADCIREYYSLLERGETKSEISFILTARTQRGRLPAVCAPFETLELVDYTEQELSEIAARQFDELGIGVGEGVIGACVRRCHGSVRDLFGFVRGLRSRSLSEGSHEVTLRMAEEYFSEMGLDTLGFDSRQISALRDLAATPGGEASVEVLAAANDALAFVFCELVLAPLVAKDLAVLIGDVCRITEKGRAHLSAVHTFSGGSS